MLLSLSPCFAQYVAGAQFHDLLAADSNSGNAAEFWRCEPRHARLLIKLYKDLAKTLKMSNQLMFMWDFLVIAYTTKELTR